MKRFMVKTILLMAALFICVIYGMEVAKQNMMNMVGETQNHTLSLAEQLSKPLPTPSSGTRSSTASSSNSQSSSSKKSSATNQMAGSANANGHTDELTQRIKKLQTIQDFNPYGSLGEGLSNSFKKTFSTGMTATTNLFDQIINHVF